MSDVDALDAVAAGPGPEQELPQVPRRGREVLVGEACSRLDHADPVALLGQPQRGDGAAEARADDEDVEVGRIGHRAAEPCSSSARRAAAGHHLREGRVGHAEHRGDPDQALGAHRLGVGVAADTLRALAPAEA